MSLSRRSVAVLHGTARAVDALPLPVQAAALPAAQGPAVQDPAARLPVTKVAGR